MLLTADNDAGPRAGKNPPPRGAEEPPGTTERWRSAIAALAVARQKGRRLLEAEALLMFGNDADPTLQPEHALSSLLEAEQIFRANGLAQSALACRLAAARAMYDLGHERRAVEVSRAALFDLALKDADRLAVLTRIALCHVRLGEIDLAFGVMRDEALPLARDTGNPPALASWRRAHAVIQAKFWVSLCCPTLWAGLPDMPAITEPAPSVDAVIGLLDAAEAGRPGEERWFDVDVARLVITGLSGSPAEAISALRKLAIQYVETDPPLAARALYCKALVLRHRQDGAGALEALTNVLALAEPLRLGALMRDALLQQSRIHESMGDGLRALAAYKRYADLRVRSVRPGAVPPLAGPPAAVRMHETTVAHTGWAGGGHLPRHLAPKHVVRALRFIDERLEETIGVAEVVRHCDVSRRTLEVAFKQSTSVSLAHYIKAGKLEHAAGLLRNTDCLIQRIALRVGYRSVNAFARNFRQRFGVNPAVWKANAVPNVSQP